jgi:predicted metal-binding protein
MVCRTCPRFADGNRWDTDTASQRLAHSVEAIWHDWAAAGSFRLRLLTCLGGCPNPCNAALSGPGKWRLRIKRLMPADAPALLELASAYHAHADGNLSPEEVPLPLRARIGARTPPYEALFGSGLDAQRQITA